MAGYTYTPWIWPLLVSAALQVVLSAYLWRRRAIAGTIPLALAMLVSAAWCVTDIGELTADQAAAKEAWFLVRDALALPGMTASLWFVLEYAGLERWLTRPVVAVLAVAAFAILPLYLVDDGRFLWANLRWNGEVRGDLAPIGLVFGLYGYAIALLGTGLLLLLFFRSPAHRAPVALIVLGQIAIRVAFPLGLLDIANVPNLASMALAVDFASLMYFVALFRFRLFDLVPVARESIFAAMPDALLILDTHDRVADVNQTALRWFGAEREELVGRPVAEALVAHRELALSIAEPGHRSRQVSLDVAGTRTCEVGTTPLSDWQGRPIGRLVLLHDISALRQVELQLVDRERALAAAQERERLARELHDGLAQDLWLAKLKATRLAAQPELAAESRALTDEVTAAVDAGIAEAREAVAAMRLLGEPGASFRELLSRMLEDFEDRFGLAVEFECAADLRALSARTEAEVLRIAQEALTNVRRHADATLVRVRAAVEDDQLVLEVKDNGRGFDVEAVGDSAYGLAGMRERGAAIGGRIGIASAPRRGTLVRLVVPVGAEARTLAGVR